MFAIICQMDATPCLAMGWCCTLGIWGMCRGSALSRNFMLIVVIFRAVVVSWFSCVV